MASTLRPPMDSTPMMVCTHSYRMAFPALRAPSVLVATCARMSLMASLADALPDPSIRSSRSTCSSAPQQPQPTWHTNVPMIHLCIAVPWRQSASIRSSLSTCSSAPQQPQHGTTVLTGPLRARASEFAALHCCKSSVCTTAPANCNKCRASDTGVCLATLGSLWAHRLHRKVNTAHPRCADAPAQAPSSPEAAAAK